MIGKQTLGNEKFLSRIESLSHKIDVVTINYLDNSIEKMVEGLIKNVYQKNNKEYLLLSSGQEILLENVKAIKDGDLTLVNQDLN